MDQTGQPPLEREHDGYIMEWIVHSNHFTDKEIARLNYCRLFLNATTLSDLTNTTGDYLDPSKLRGAPSLLSSTSKWMAAHQEKPSDSGWKLWEQANRLWSQREGKLHQPLGRWLQVLPMRRIQHFAYKHQCHLFIRTHNGYI